MMKMNKTPSRLCRRIASPSLTAYITRTPLALAAFALAASVLLAGCTPKPAAEETPTVTVQVAGAASQPIELKVTADAVIYPLDQAAIVPKISSPVKKFYVNRGS